jgi:signal transduction histidine kinase
VTRSEDKAEAPGRPVASSAGWLGRFGLSSRILGLAILFVLVVEALVFLPSAANYRANWVETRVEQARIAVLALDASPDRMVSDELERALLERAGVLGVAEGVDGMRVQLFDAVRPPAGTPIMVRTDRLRTFGAVGDTLGALFGSPDRLMVIRDAPAEGEYLDILVPLGALKSELIAFCWRILGLSLFIAIAVGALIYLALYLYVVRPIKRVTASVEQFRDNPRDWTRKLETTRRSDQIGRAQNALAELESAVQSAFRQRERMAQLGEAMAKINHDLRNSLAAAQLVSDGLARSEDPKVQRAAPRLERALERAINLAQATLSFGKGETLEARVETVALDPALNEALEEGLAAHPGIDWKVRCDDIHCRADADYLHRIIVNLSRNSAQAMVRHDTPEACLELSAINGGGHVEITLADNGPGIPSKVREKLFQPFSAAGSRDGTGLGLAIARELAEAMGADLSLVKSDATGTEFRLQLPAG